LTETVHTHGHMTYISPHMTCMENSREEGGRAALTFFSPPSMLDGLMDGWPASLFVPSCPLVGSVSLSLSLSLSMSLSLVVVGRSIAFLHSFTPFFFLMDPIPSFPYKGWIANDMTIYVCAYVRTYGRTTRVQSLLRLIHTPIPTYLPTPD